MYKYSIEEILDLKNGKIIYASKLFAKSTMTEDMKLREALQEVISDPSLPALCVCLHCFQKVRIKGSIHSSLQGIEIGKKVFHFAHLKDSDDCPIKTNSGFSKEEIERMKYNGLKESEPHKRLKALLEGLLEITPYVSEILVEKRQIGIQNTRLWRRPDVAATFYEYSMVFEIQLSTTFLSVIVDRQIFYRQKKSFILWVFQEFDTNDATRKVAFSDASYANNGNAYVLDNETLELSREEGMLYFKCYYLEYFIDNDRIESDWKECFINLFDLTFDYKTMKVYYKDTYSQYTELKKELQQKLAIQKQQEKEKRIDVQNVLAKRHEIGEDLNKIWREIQALKVLKEDLEDRTSNIEDFTKKLMYHLVNNVPSKLKEHEIGIFDDIPKKDIFHYLDTVKVLGDIQLKDFEYKKYQKSIAQIECLNQISIDRTLYSIFLFKDVSENFLKKNISKVKVIEKTFLDGNTLILENSPKKVSDIHELNTLAESHYILFDFSQELEDYRNKVHTHEKELGEALNNKKDAFQLINAVVSNIVEEMIQQLEKKIGNLHKEADAKYNVLDTLKGFGMDSIESFL